MDFEKIFDGLLTDARHHLREEIEGFMLEFDERILLRVGAKADAFLQLIQIVEMLFPGDIDHLQKNHALKLRKKIGADFRFARLNQRR